jgi:hypothetical protein
MFPFVTIPSFEQRAAAVLSLSNALEITLHPIVTSENRRAWEKYSVGEDKSWM